MFWSIQLHPDDLSWNREKELLKNLKLVGIGDYWPQGESQIIDFKKNMKINDIVLVRHGSKPLALVKVVGNFEDIGRNDFERVDWFRFRRKIEILDWAYKKKEFPFTRKTLQKHKDKTTPSYQYIKKWYDQIIGKEFLKKDKIKKIYISNYKVLEDFTLSFEYEKEDNILPIVVLVGENGTGKTSILEFIANLYDITYQKDKFSFVEINEEMLNFFDEPREVLQIGKLADYSYNKRIKKYEEKIIYLDINNINALHDTQKYIVNELKKQILEEKQEINGVYERFKKIINQYLKELNIKFKFDHITLDDQVVFKNKNTNKTFLFEELSSGEKTIISKLLFLFLKVKDNRIVLIDEPELSLHPYWQNRILSLYEKYAKENNCQIIIATHSPHIIGSAKAEYIKLLTFGNNKIKVLTTSRSYGLEFQKILLDIMGIKELRTPEIEEKILNLKQSIENKNKNEFLKIYQELINILGEDDTDLQLLKLQANIKGLNV